MQEGLDGREGEDGLQEGGVDGDGVDDLDGDGSKDGRAEDREVDLWMWGRRSAPAPPGSRRHGTHLGKVDELVALERLADLVDVVRDALGRGSTVPNVVLDPKVVGRSSRVVARREEDASRGLARADDVRDGGGGEDAVLADDEVRDAVACCDLDDLLDALGGVEASVSADDEGRVGGAGGGDPFEDGLDKVLGVVLLLKDDDPARRDWDEWGTSLPR